MCLKLIYAIERKCFNGKLLSGTVTTPILMCSG